MAIKTPRFHKVDGPADPKLREAVMRADHMVPQSYKAFVLKFGNAKLYRTSRTGYRIGIFSAPRQSTLNDGTRIYHFGFNDGASVYFKPSSQSRAPLIFEYEDNSEQEVATDFEAWLSASCLFARSKYSELEWNQIKRGPQPFTAEEKEMIKARRGIHWKVLGIDPLGNHIFEVRNDGEGKLLWLTVGVRSKDGGLNGAVRLDVGDVGPGQSAVLHRDCYKDLMPPDQIEAFPIPDPAPEDRDYYYEFSKRNRP